MNLTESPLHEKFKIGEKAPYFCLPATDGKLYSLSNFSNSACLVVIFTSNHCPYAKLYEPRIIELVNEFQKQNVSIIAICSNDGSAFPEDSFENMKLKKYPFPYLHDESQIVAKAFDAQATPEAYVFDSEFTLRYHGAIDDTPEAHEAVKQHYLRDAINAILTDTRIEITEAPLIGCSIKWKIS